MASALGLVLQTNRISMRYLRPRVSRLKYCRNISFRQNYGLARPRLMNTEPERNNQMRNGKVRYLFTGVPNR